MKVGISDAAIERDRKIRMEVKNKRPNEKLRKGSGSWKFLTKHNLI